MTGRSKPKYCPFCDGVDTLTMSLKTLTKLKDKKVMKAEFQIWTCSKCGEGFFYEWNFYNAGTGESV